MKISDFNLAEFSPQTGEHLKIIELFSGNDADFPKRTLVQLFDEQARRFPEKIAVTDAEGAMNYRELADRSHRLASFILKHTTPGVFVGLLFNHSNDLIVSILAVLRSGCAYLPIDPSIPFERMKILMEDACSPLLLSQRRFIKNSNKLLWEIPTLKSFACVDSSDVRHEMEESNELMNPALWDYIGEKATDQISSGGWFSSYTGLAFSQEEMDEYVENTVSRLRPWLTKNNRVLEIGCASGLTMFAIAPHVSEYHGIDISQGILSETSRLAIEKGHDNVHLHHLSASEIDRLAPLKFDVVIINSVVQNFSGHNYLRDVIEKSIALIDDSGVVFLGDLLDLDLRSDLVGKVTRIAGANSRPGLRVKTDWSNELFVSRSFLYDLQADLNGIDKVVVLPKEGKFANELNEFRFDALLVVTRNAQSGTHVRIKNQYSIDDIRSCEVTECPAGSPSDAAYVMYTSGSTGLPKGCVVTHENVVRLILNDAHPYEFGSSDVWILAHSYNFDVSVWEIFGALLYGGHLVVADRVTQRDIELFHALVKSHKITVLCQTPFAFKAFSEYEKMQSLHTLGDHLRYVIFAGEKLEPSNLRDWIKWYPLHQLKLVNMYGITETTVHSTYYEITLSDIENGDRSIIGKPLPETRIYIVNEQLEPVAIGEEGEILVGGTGVTLGYLNNTSLTTQRFLSDPFSVGRVYRSGDLAKWMPDGNIEYIGRKDRQVKIRGYRVETGEVERALLRHRMVQDCVVMTMRDAGQLIAFYKTSDVVDDDELKKFLGEVLPHYMVPTYWKSLDKFPLTRNGKIDYVVLLDEHCSFSGDDEIKLPQTSLQRTLAELWREVLGKRIGINQDFFQMGGHSLSAFRLVVLMNKRLRTQLRLKTVFTHPTIEQMAAFLEKTGTTIVDDYIRFSDYRQDATDLFFFPPAFGTSVVFKPLTTILEGNYNMFGFQYPGWEGDTGSFKSIREMAASFAETIVRIKGDRTQVNLVGYSMGALVAFEIGKMLFERGVYVKLVLLDKMLSSQAELTSGWQVSTEFQNRLRENFGAEEISQFKQSYQTNLRLTHTYTVEGIFPGDVLAVRSTGNPYPSDVADWEKYCGGTFQYAEIQGTHHEVLSESNLPKVAALIRRFFLS